MALTTTSKGLVTVFGGSGFLGRHVVRALLKRGWRVRAAVRRPDLAGHLQPLGMVGWVQPMQANLRYRWSVDRAVEGADAVINLVAILNETGRQRFDAVNSFGARAVAEAARGAGLKRVIHISAIGADPDSPSVQARTKAAGEAAVFETLPDSVVFRPSIAFGQEDHFFNRFAALSRVTPALPLFGGGHTRFQPVFVGDIARAVADAVDGKAKPGTTYELGGPEVKTFRECLETTLAAIDRRRLLVPVPWWLASAKASVLQLWPWHPLLTVDEVRQLEDRQRRLRGGHGRGPHLRRLRHHAGQPGGDPALLSLPLPTARRVRAPPHGLRCGPPSPPPERGRWLCAAKPEGVFFAALAVTPPVAMRPALPFQTLGEGEQSISRWRLSRGWRRRRSPPPGRWRRRRCATRRTRRSRGARRSPESRAPRSAPPGRRRRSRGR